MLIVTCQLPYVMDKPLVSIWIPVYNGAHLIRKALESCINQTYRNLEIVVFDDCSSDNTDEVVAEFVKRDARVKYHKTPSRLGQNRSYVKILELCTGELTHMLCCDDWLSRHYMEEVVKIFREYPRAGAVTGRTWSIAEKDGRWVFSRESNVKSGMYSRRYFGTQAYRNFLTSMVILGTVRKDGARRAMRRISELAEAPPASVGSEIANLMQKSEYGGEFIYNAEVMAGYDCVGVSERSILMKTELPDDHYLSNKRSMRLRAEAGIWPHERSAQGIFKFFYFSRKLYDVAFERDWKEYISPMRAFFAREAFSTAVVEWMKSHFRRGFFRGADTGMLFEGYSFREKFLSIALVPFRLARRLLHWARREMFPSPVPDIGQEEYFLDRKGNFCA